MSIALVQSTSGSAPSNTLVASTTVSIPSSTTPGNCLVVVAATGSATPIGGGGANAGVDITDNFGNTFVPIVEVNILDFRLGIHVAVDILGGASHTVTATKRATGAVNSWQTLAVLEYSGVASAAPVDTSNSATGSSTSAATSTITAASGELLVGAATAADFASNALTVGSGWTSRINLPNGTNQPPLGVEEQISPGSAVGAAYTFASSANWLAALAALKPTSTVPGSIKVVQAASGQPAGSSAVSGMTLNLSASTTSGNFLAVAIATYNTGGGASGACTLSDNKGNTFTSAGAKVNGNSRIEVFYCANIAGGASHTLTVGLAGGSTNSFMGTAAVEYSGVSASGTLNLTNSYASTSPSNPAALAPPGGELYLAAVTDTTRALNQISLNSGFTVGWNQRGNLSDGTNQAPVALVDMISDGTSRQMRFAFGTSTSVAQQNATFRYTGESGTTPPAPAGGILMTM